jgi:hypothetical protein
MSDPSGWIWDFLGIVGVGGLGVAIAYAVNQWRHRRKDFVTRSARDRATREVYRQDELTDT